MSTQVEQLIARAKREAAERAIRAPRAARLKDIVDSLSFGHRERAWTHLQSDELFAFMLALGDCIERGADVSESDAQFIEDRLGVIVGEAVRS